MKPDSHRQWDQKTKDDGKLVTKLLIWRCENAEAVVSLEKVSETETLVAFFGNCAENVLPNLRTFKCCGWKTINHVNRHEKWS